MADREPPETDPLEGIAVYCTCGHLFYAPRSLKGGLTNCPRCHKATEVPGGPEKLFWFLLLLGILVFAVPAVALLLNGWIAAGLSVLGVGTVVISSIVAAS